MLKDFLLIGIILFILVKYIFLHKKFVKQREYFIDTLSHSLRVSVLAQIRGMDLLQKKLEGTEAEELITEVNKGCRYTFDMITMLLNTYRYQKGDPVLKYETVNLEEIVSSSCEQLEFLAVEKDIEFSLDIEAKSLLEADRYGLSKAIYTLLSTAIYNSNKRNYIYVKTKKSIHNIEITVIYHGKSLTKEECQRIFSDNPRFATVGHGIKMHLCKRIVDYHRGEFIVKNCGENKNSFTIKLPLEKRGSSAKSPVESLLQTSNI